MYEIERKWLFDSTEVPSGVEKIGDILYKRAYISTDPEIRLCIEKTKSGNIYSLTFKSKGQLKRVEIERELSGKEFWNIMDMCNIKKEDMVQKSSSVFLVGEYSMILCVVDEGTDHSFIYGEIEFKSEEDAKKFEAPVWFGKEVTYDEYYKMRNYWKRCRERNELLQESEDFIQTKFGYCFYSLEPNPFIYNLYIHPQYRKQGHSKNLLNFVISIIRDTGYDGKIRIEARPREESIKLDALINYYQKMGLTI